MTKNELLSDNEFIKFKHGNNQAYRKVFDQYFGLVQYIVRRCGISNGDVSDIVQEIFFRLYQNRACLRHQSVIKTWLATSAKNLSIDFSRKQSRLTSLTVEQNNEAEDHTHQNLIRELEIILIGKLLDQISEETGESSATDFYKHGLSAKQIAIKNNEPISSVTNRLSRFRHKFGTRLKQHIEELRAASPEQVK